MPGHNKLSHHFQLFETSSDLVTFTVPCILDSFIYLSLSEVLTYQRFIIFNLTRSKHTCTEVRWDFQAVDSASAQHEYLYGWLHLGSSCLWVR